jgi:hypothetical protein
MNPDGRDKRPAKAGWSRRTRIFMGGGGASGAIADCGLMEAHGATAVAGRWRRFHPRGWQVGWYGNPYSSRQGGEKLDFSRRTGVRTPAWRKATRGAGRRQQRNE